MTGPAPYIKQKKNRIGSVEMIQLTDNSSTICLYSECLLRYDISELQETGGGAEMRAAEAAERNLSVSLHRVKTWPQLMCCALI